MRAATRILREALADLDQLESDGWREADAGGDEVAIARQLRQLDHERADIHAALDRLDPAWLEDWADPAQADLFLGAAA